MNTYVGGLTEDSISTSKIIDPRSELCESILTDFCVAPRARARWYIVNPVDRSSEMRSSVQE